MKLYTTAKGKGAAEELKIYRDKEGYHSTIFQSCSIQAMEANHSVQLRTNYWDGCNDVRLGQRR